MADRNQQRLREFIHQLLADTLTGHFHKIPGTDYSIVISWHGYRLYASLYADSDHTKPLRWVGQATKKDRCGTTFPVTRAAKYIAKHFDARGINVSEIKVNY